MKKEDYKVGDKIVVEKVAEISKGRYKKGDVGVIKSIDSSAAPFNVYFRDSGNIYALYLKEFKLYKPKDNWIPFKGGKCPVGQYDKVLVQFEDGRFVIGDSWNCTLPFDNHLFWSDDIVAYQVITPYNPPREKVIYENKKEMLTDLISRGKLYLNKEGEEHIYFSEDERYTIGYVDNKGREEVADEILDELEWWVED